MLMPENKEIILGGGCFWCVEAVFQNIKGVTEVVSGYGGGLSPEPSYQSIGDHAEVIRVSYSSKTITLKELLEIFFSVHDPTTKDRQGADIGSQYRSIVICSKDEVEIVEQSIRDAQRLWGKPIVTEIIIDGKFFPAEDYHQDFYQQNQSSPYCQVVINPKLAKFRDKFSKYLK